ncbi:MAG: holo-[acyl-carrier-protein] synthase [Chloroflexi bacterium]|nr:holo-[acyl-carrier-protein] synthase [Chloroflexota bacterium]
MKLATGLDLVEIDRLRAAIERHGERFLHRVFTNAELDTCGGSVESLAARWAAKEAVAKALGCGIGEVSFREIEVLRDDSGAPRLVLHGAGRARARRMGLASWSLSISHSRSVAAAVAVALGEAGGSGR